MTSKSEQIRQVAREIGPKARPSGIAQTLRNRGVAVNAGQVRSVLASMDRPLTLEALLAAKRLADQLGGVEAAKTAVDVLAKLTI